MRLEHDAQSEFAGPAGGSTETSVRLEGSKANRGLFRRASERIRHESDRVRPYAPYALEFASGGKAAVSSLASPLVRERYPFQVPGCGPARDLRRKLHLASGNAVSAHRQRFQQIPLVEFFEHCGAVLSHGVLDPGPADHIPHQRRQESSISCEHRLSGVASLLASDPCGRSAQTRSAEFAGGVPRQRKSHCVGTWIAPCPSHCQDGLDPRVFGETVPDDHRHDAAPLAKGEAIRKPAVRRDA